jgi:hypothetical protein
MRPAKVYFSIDAPGGLRTAASRESVTEDRGVEGVGDGGVERDRVARYGGDRAVGVEGRPNAQPRLRRPRGVD